MRETKGRGKPKAKITGKGAGVERKRFVRRKSCKFCGEKVGGLDFRDTLRISKFTSERGKILPRRISGNCARHQRDLARAVKRARSVALMPYVTVE